MNRTREEPTCLNCGHHAWDEVDNKREVFFLDGDYSGHKGHKAPELHFWTYRQRQAEIEVVYIIDSVNAQRPNGNKAALVQEVYNWPAGWSRSTSGVGYRALREAFLRQKGLVLKELTTALNQKAGS